VAGWQETYPALHRALAPEYRDLGPEQVEAIVHGTFGEDVTLADAEGFFDDVGRALSGAARAAAPVVQRALPGVVSGAMGGAALGPFGMLGGALLGGIGSALGPGGRPQPADVPAGLIRPPVPQPAGTPPGAVGPPLAVAQLLGALGSPTVQRALGSMLLGRAGARTVPTAGGTEVPVAAITNLLGMLAGRASAEWEMIAPSPEAESFAEGLDFAAPEVRAEWLFERLEAIDLDAEDVEAWGGESGDESWLDEMFDELDAELVEASDEAFDESDESFDELVVPEWSWAHDG
jgi:hypothetical protein